MADDVRVVGADQFGALAQRLKQAGEGGLMKEVRKDFRRIAQPAAQIVGARTPEFLPNRYAEDLSGSLKVTVLSPAGRGARVILRGRARTAQGKARELKKLDAGLLRHPLWGRWRRGKGFQSVRPGFWTEPLTDQESRFREAASAAIARVAQKIERG